MCAYCREMKDKKGLFRIVLPKNKEPFLDLTFKADGRGAYLCKNIECIKGGFKKRSIERSLSHKVKDEIYNEMSEIIENYW